MAAQGVVTSIGYLSIRTRDLSASVKDAEEVLGLRVVESSAKKAFLSAADAHHEIVYVQDEQDAVDHFALGVESVEELLAIRTKVDASGYPIVSEHPIEDHVEVGFAFVGPEGFTWQPYVTTEWRDAALGGGVGPNRYGHINYRVVDVEAQKDFLVDVFGFMVSDRIGDGDLYFLRCSNEHHGIAVGRNDLVGLHHHAWGTQSMVDIGRLGDRLARRGRRLLWGPVRHGAGNNIAGYYVEPSGGVVELYTDMEFIYNPKRPIHQWDRSDSYWANQWNSDRNPQMGEYNTVPLDRGLALL